MSLHYHGVFYSNLIDGLCSACDEWMSERMTVIFEKVINKSASKQSSPFSIQLVCFYFDELKCGYLKMLKHHLRKLSFASQLWPLLNNNNNKKTHTNKQKLSSFYFPTETCWIGIHIVQPQYIPLFPPRPIHSFGIKMKNFSFCILWVRASVCVCAHVIAKQFLDTFIHLLAVWISRGVMHGVYINNLLSISP